MMLTDTQYQELVHLKISYLFDKIDEICGRFVDVDLLDGNLQLGLNDGRTYVISKHLPSRELWVSSPLSGARHFRWDIPSQNWVDTRGTDVLGPWLATELTQATGATIELD